MAEYIEREATKIAIHNMDAGRREKSTLLSPEEFAEYLDEFPAADVAPVVRAEWVNPHWRNNDYCYDCSNCGGEAMHRIYRWRDEKIYPICPNCGARMYGGADNETD